MPNAARQLRPEAPDLGIPTSDAGWSGETHGPVGALHRAIEERLLASGDTMVVLPMQVSRAEAIAQAVSRVVGWSALGGCFAVAALLLR